MESKITVGYWALRGFAERIRQICQYLGVTYDQVKYSGELNSESRKKWFEQDKPNLQKKNPAITLPYLIDGEKVIAESDACCVYLCHKTNRKDLLGRNPEEQVILYTALGILKDIQEGYITYAYVTYGQGTFQEALNTHRSFCRSMIGCLKKFNGILGDKKYICGDGLVWVDFALADFIQILAMVQPMVLDNYQKLVEYQKRVWGLPELKGYFESERFSERPVNNTHAKWRG